MKTKKNKKLDFSKKEIINLSNDSLSKVNGGWTTITSITKITEFSKNTLCTSDVK